MLKEYAKNCDWKLPSDIENYILWTDSRLFEKIKSEDNIWAKRIAERKAYLRLYEVLFFEFSSGIRQKKEMEALKENLKKEGVNFIEAHSEKDTIKPSKNTLKKYNIYLKNKVLNQTKELYEDPAFLPLPDRKIRRIYVEPESFSKAQSVLNQMNS